MKKQPEYRSPPRIAEWLLKKITSDRRTITFLGDLGELYNQIIEDSGISKAWIWYWFQLIQNLYSRIINIFIGSTTMFKNYLKIAFRNIKRYKGYAIINVSGLTLGITCCILIMVYVLDELSFDKYHKNTEKIYRISTNATLRGNNFQLATSPAIMAPTLVSDYPEVVDAVRIRQHRTTLITYKENFSYQDNYISADKNLFDFFTWKLIKGDPETVLDAPYKAAISEETAVKYFGTEDPYGNILNINGEDFIVSGIFEKIPSNSHFSFEVVTSLETMISQDPSRFNQWASFEWNTYILTGGEFSENEFSEKLLNLNKQYMQPIFEPMGASVSSYLQPLTSIHLHSKIGNELGSNSDIGFVYAFSTIAFIILLVACINFMNLSTARASYRAKEVGVRKALGAYRKNLKKQFIGESFIYCLLSLLLALISFHVLLPFFNQLSGKQIQLDFLRLPGMIIGVLLIVIAVGFLAGSYPAQILSRFQPSIVLKGNLNAGNKNSKFRNILVVFQFTISIILIIGSIIIYNQLNYMKNKDLGFRDEMLLVIPLPDQNAVERLESIKDEMLNINGVQMAAGSRLIPGGNNYYIGGFFPEGDESAMVLEMAQSSVDPDFFDTYGIEFIKGRPFSEDMVSDQHNGLIINETAAKRLGWDDPIGKTIKEVIDPSDVTNMFERTIIGVVKDFHFASLYNVITPLRLTFDRTRMNRLTLKISTNVVAETIEAIEEKWQEIAPGKPMEYYFLDESFNNKYKKDENLGVIFQVFTFIAVFIGCLGLFGLASFTTEQRRKEIGIRKTLGSNTSSNLLLLSKNYLILILLANLISWPLAYFSMNLWLNNFPYKTDTGIGIYFLAAVITLVVAVITVSYQCIKASLANPVDSLRYE
ncbi:ABC transporter permease [candidate division KSB1 bacterium]